MKGYWFSREDGTADNQRVPAEIGRTDTVAGAIVPCEHGLHSSPTPWDALQYACGPVLWEVEIGGEIVPHGNPVDKHASSTRTYLRRVDVTVVLRRFAAERALSVIHLWDAPPVVREYLESVTADCERVDIRDAARAAAWAAARAAARAAAKNRFNELCEQALDGRQQ